MSAASLFAPPPKPATSDGRGLIVDLFAGGVPAAASTRSRFASSVDASGDGCWMWKGGRQTRSNGNVSYGVFCADGRRWLAHRMSWRLAHGEIPAGAVVLHHCDEPGCVRPDHLSVGSQADNLEDMRRKGRAHFNTFPTGVEHPNAKMTPGRVRAIRARRLEGVSFVKLGLEFGIHAATAHDIVRRRTWRHVR